MVLDARECAQRRDVDAHPPSQLGGIARPPGHYVPPPHDTTTTALATTSRESSTTYYSHDATYILHGTTIVDARPEPRPRAKMSQTSSGALRAVARPVRRGSRFVLGTPTTSLF